MNPNIPRKTKSFQRLQNKEEIELKIKGEKMKKKIENFGNLRIN